MNNTSVASGIQFNKKYGQNFIFDSNLLSAIVQDAGITAEDTVVEIGAGAGTLTAELAKVAHRVVAYEIDTKLEKVLTQKLAAYKNVELFMTDFMKEKTPLPHPFKVVANLPYYITTPIIMRFIEGDDVPESITVMVQKEVADRLVAAPDCKDYGAITAQINMVAEARITRIVGRHNFIPSPNVDSAVVRIDRVEKGYSTEVVGKAKKLIKAAFAMRRKTLVNNLIQGANITRANAEELLKELGLPLTVRGETLSSGQFAEMAKKMIERK